MSKLLAASGSASNYSYEVALGHATAAGLKASNVRPHTIMVALPTQASPGAYEFKLRSSQNAFLSDIATYLQDTDVMVVDHVGVMIQQVKCRRANGNLTYFPANSRLYPYPDKAIFSGAANTNGVAEWEGLLGIFNGKMQIETEDNILLKDYPMENFLYVPETQRAAATEANIPGIVARRWGKPFAFAGDKDTSVTITVKGGDFSGIAGTIPTTDNTNGAQNFLWLVLSGHVIREAAASVRLYQK